MKAAKTKTYSDKGFTLLELMIVIGMVVILTVMTVPYGLDFYRARVLDEETETLSAILERARSRAMTGKMDSDWGVSFGEDCYTIFMSKSDEYDREFCPPSGVEIDHGDMSEIIFERHTGRPQIYN